MDKLKEKCQIAVCGRISSYRVSIGCVDMILWLVEKVHKHA